MLKIWGRNTSSNVQKVIWALAELKLPQRIDVGGAFGKTKDPLYLAMNPNCAGADARRRGRLHAVGVELDLPLPRRQARQSRTLEPADLKTRARAQTVDGLAALGDGAGDHAGVLGPDPHAAGEARPEGDRAGRKDHRSATQMMDAPARQDEIHRRRRILLRRHSGRHDDLSLHAAHARSARQRRISIAGTPRSRRARPSRTRRGGAAV